MLQDAAYCGLHNLAENWSWARDVNSRDRDETETLTIFLETRPRRDVATYRHRDVEPENTTLINRPLYFYSSYVLCGSFKF